MSKKDQEDKDKFEFDFGLGKIEFRNLFKGFRELIESASKLSEEGKEKTGEISGLPRGLKGVYGLKINTLAGKPVIETFGNIKDTEKGPTVDKVREPIVDVFEEENDIIKIIAELPGVEEDKIEIEINGDILNLKAEDTDKKYAKEILLPHRIVPESLEKEYKNGVLMITLKNIPDKI
jgi:HSP20 family protein